MEHHQLDKLHKSEASKQVCCDDPLAALYGRLVARLEAPLQLLLRQGALLDGALEELVALLFPLAYERALGGGGGSHRLAAEYRGCLRRAAKELRPAGDAPRRLATPLQHALRAAGVLRQALLPGARVLSSADSLLNGQGGPTGASAVASPVKLHSGAAAEAQCHAALVRMSHCWRCRGLHRRVRPCAGLCLNVLRGCLTQRAAELDLPWNGYVEAAERLLAAVQGRAALDDVLCALDARIAEAAAAAVERSATLQQQYTTQASYGTLEVCRVLSTDEIFVGRSGWLSSNGARFEVVTEWPGPCDPLVPAASLLLPLRA
ncbi:glypican-4-like [Schistocerca gregaria]|uniref:glypican-4-like n=1 Tax=Schistocerca gregaria TaxID=7010 RepID=UPI00211EDF47|nr:glypican-4-like [Schistocerca gregaria]